MYARSRTRSPAGRRRGVVLILVLAMMGLLAVIGVSFATFSGQARSAARSYSKKLNRPRVDALFNYAIGQLINDTSNPMSALYGHGLKRDMYGSDGDANGFLDQTPTGQPLQIAGNPAPTGTPATSGNTIRWTVTTNLPFNGFNYISWYLRLPQLDAIPNVSPASASHTLQVTNQREVGGVYQFDLSGVHVMPRDSGGNPLLTRPLANMQFELDSRFRHAFNGTGMAALNSVTSQSSVVGAGNAQAAQFGNFRLSGGLLNGNRDAVAPFDLNASGIGVDEDYDAPDLENWFLAVQSADGRTVIPSFHRPGILVDHDPANPGVLTDMTFPGPQNYAVNTADRFRSVRAVSKILRPRPVDHPTAGFSALSPNADGTITYDVDNDGDGQPDSVWLDLGYPAQRADDGTLYKPLFSFMVLGLNGRMPLNTAGNLNNRFAVDDPATPNVDEAGMPLFSHASHLGYSPSEINPSYGLQNTLDSTLVGGVNVPDEQKPLHQQFDDAVYPGASYRHIPVSLTQLRSLLTGTRPFDENNADANSVLVQGRRIGFANNVNDEDPTDPVERSGSPVVPGRWGEPNAVPPQLNAANTGGDIVAGPLHRALNFSDRNPVQPGYSPFSDSQYRVDGIDDNYDTYDFAPPRPDPSDPQLYGPEAGQYYADQTFDPAIRRNLYLDLSAGLIPGPQGMPLLASERYQRFVTPIDPTGVGQVYRFNRVPNDPASLLPPDIGPDSKGRVGFFHYFRPPGVPLDVDDYDVFGAAGRSIHNADGGGAPARLIPNENRTSAPNRPSYPLARSRHNEYRGFESFRAPGGTNASHMAAMPYDRSTAPDAAGNPASNRGYAPRDPANPNLPLPPDNLFDTANGAYVGTFTDAVNSRQNSRLLGPIPAGAPAAVPATPVHNYPLTGSLLYNDPNEMNLYQPDGTDAPFGLTDLEWLYRSHDVDGDELDSRLAQLAPISFVEAADSLTRRRLFSVETWDRIDATFAHDNPDGVGNVFDTSLSAPYLSAGDPARAPSARQQLAQVNARFAAGASASIDLLGLQTPNIHHRGRRINLNHPLPHSYDPYEPVRQKWISETYETLKLILPPQSIDTPHELAQLGQFVVNIIDFRDPDNTITIWENPDLLHLPARRDGSNNYPPSIHLPYLDTGAPDLNVDSDGDGVVDYDPTLDAGEAGLGAYENPLARRLTTYGMEYQPVALNEVLAFRFNYFDPGGPATNSPAVRFYIELVNMLTKDGIDDADQPDGHDPADLDLQYWDFVLVREDPTVGAPTPGTPYYHPVYVRPDPITGQVPQVAGVAPPVLPDDFAGTAAEITALPPEQARPVVVGTGKAVEPNDTGTSFDERRRSYIDFATVSPFDGTGGGLDKRVPAMDPDEIGDPASYFVIGGTRFGGTGTPPPLDDLLEDELRDDNDGKFFDPDDWDLIPDSYVDAAATSDASPFKKPDGTDRKEGLYHWLYLRRPANPLLPPDPNTNPLVVVDSIRFPFSASDGRGQESSGTAVVLNSPTQPIYAIERPQPFRGGQIVPDPDDRLSPLYIYGTSEQARAIRSGGGDETYYNLGGMNQVATTEDIRHTLEDPNRAGRYELDDGTNDEDFQEAWDYVVFNDRDFMSVAELMLVPGSPPGLFTKQFASQPPPPDRLQPGSPALTIPQQFARRIAAAPAYTPATSDTITTRGAFYRLPPTSRSGGSIDFDFVPGHWAEDAADPGNAPTNGVSPAIEHTEVRSYPYLVDKFFYTSDPRTVIDPSVAGDGHRVGGPTSAGWHRMLEFFEVPSPVLDAIGPVAQGVNFDWYRQDLRPGLLNPNLIVDEEVFFGLLDDPRLLDAGNVIGRIQNSNNTSMPRVVTQVDLNGTPTASYPMANRGVTVFTTDAAGQFLSTEPTSLNYPQGGMKLPFADFLKQRHGGSGFLFAYGDGATGAPYPGAIAGNDDQKVSRDRPYRSLAYPYIQSTLLRPATMEPSAFTNPVLDVNPYAFDPGLRNRHLDPGFLYRPVAANPRSYYPALRTQVVSTFPRIPPIGFPIVPPVPPRRLFQVPDYGISNETSTAPNFDYGLDHDQNAATAVVGRFSGSNAAVGTIANDSNPTHYVPIADVNAANTARPLPSIGMSGGATPTTLFPPQTTTTSEGPPAVGVSYLGGTFVPTPPSASGPDPIGPFLDMRRHPYYRTELIQKMTNLTTPRTHQFAVWVTVGFFEVVRPGDRAQLVPDELGPELGSASGNIARHRMFFILDRSRATGYDPRNPGQYRDVVLWSRRIE
ncbi:hypothetical protein [Tautonia plasticadhaerens]|uniref:Uncharacterized protein n=1 Tax=Tautonia plasticadhaerens TaxID=2527974 RepID=A0A518H504_9BACT|nr:hypothetical protein [Tautonia plasticadhaerens]QDV35898.1 hypothetical protein ElP_38060 [Tautonia plasticadhaerens]